MVARIPDLGGPGLGDVPHTEATARLTASFASNRIVPLAVTVVEPITTQGAVREAAKAARQAEDDGPAGPMGCYLCRARLRRDGVLVGAAAGSVADQ